jgi:F1F0 ATPase subunit 2
MNVNVVDIALSFAAGMAAGGAYFAALWLTVRWLTRYRLAPAWLLVSAVVRLAFLIAILFWIMDNDVTKLFAALAGFLVVRLAATWRARFGGDLNRGGLSKITTPEVIDATDPR